MKVFEKKIPTKNYFIVLIVSVLTIIVCLYVRSFYLSYEMNKTSDSIFNDKSINQMNISDTDFVLSEVNEAIIYVSYDNSKDINNMEKRLFREINKKKLTDKVIYWNVSNLKNDNKYISILRDKFPNIAYEINNAPMLIYIKDGEAIEAVSSEIKLIDYTAFNKLVNKYEIE